MQTPENIFDQDAALSDCKWSIDMLKFFQKNITVLLKKTDILIHCKVLKKNYFKDIWAW